MEKYEHLRLPIFQADLPRKKRGGGASPKLPTGRVKSQFSSDSINKVEELQNSISEQKKKFSGKVNPSLIFEMKINDSVSPDFWGNNLTSMGIQILSVAENKKGYWIVFADDYELKEFKRKLEIYGSQGGANYDFFNAIDFFGDIPVEKKIGRRLSENPLGDEPEFIDIELWRMTDKKKNEDFIKEIKELFNGQKGFRISDEFISRSFVLLRIKLTKTIFDELIQFKEIARADRPAIPQFNILQHLNPNFSEIEFNELPENSVGVLVVDSGIISNHPMLEKCFGHDENFQSVESEKHDTVGHGTSVAGCAAYNDIEKCLEEKIFTPSNRIFSAKVMYARRNEYDGEIYAEYDPEKLVEHQLQEAVENFLYKESYNIRVVNLSLGNSSEVWHKDYYRQLPLAALIDDLAFNFPNVVFIISAGNTHPLDFFDTIEEVIEKYPEYLLKEDDAKIINPATSALALTVGSIAHKIRIQTERFGSENIKVNIANENEPSPFSRSGPGINGMVKPELVEYGGNLILYDNHGRVSEDVGGKLPLLNNQVTGNIIKFDSGTSYAAPKVAHLAGRIAADFPARSGNFIKNMILMGASDPFKPNKDFYKTKDNSKAELANLQLCGYGISSHERAINSFSNRVVLWDESQIPLNQFKIYSLELPEIFFNEKGKKKIIVTLTFNPETRMTRGDSYLGNRMEFHVFHSVNPKILSEKYAAIQEDLEEQSIPKELEKFEIGFIPGANIRKAGCHQKAWKEYKKEPTNIPKAPISLVLVNVNKWLTEDSKNPILQDYCISVTFEHEKEIELYNQIRTKVQVRARA